LDFAFGSLSQNTAHVYQAKSHSLEIVKKEVKGRENKTGFLKKYF